MLERDGLTGSDKNYLRKRDEVTFHVKMEENVRISLLHPFYF